MIRLKNSELNLVEKTEQKLNRVDFIPPVTGRERTKQHNNPFTKKHFPILFHQYKYNPHFFTLSSKAHFKKYHLSRAFSSFLLW
jgi:glucose dehydrogenase